MKICQVNPGCGIPIPPPSWGAIEKIVWELTCNLKELGHEVDIKWANEIQPGEYDLVMVHVANLALELASNNVSYVFQHHDHHAYHYGKDSTIYKQNREVMEKSIFYLGKKINTKIRHLDGPISEVEQTTKKPFFKQRVAKVQKN